jgi:hypothetical protein
VGTLRFAHPTFARLRKADEMAEPWAFGWTQLLTLAGLILTALIAVFGFRTFGRWKREKLEERRIEVAFDALTIAYETKFVFQHIRGAITHGYEWADMPKREGETEDKRSRRGPFYATFKRIEHNKEFFDKVWQLQSKCMAVFGRKIEDTFIKLHQARRGIEVAAQMLAEQVDDPVRSDDEDTHKLYQQLRRDIWDHGGYDKEKDKIGKLLQEFEQELEAAAKPIVDREYKPTT